MQELALVDQPQVHIRFSCLASNTALWGHKGIVPLLISIPVMKILRDILSLSMEAPFIQLND